MCIRDSVKPVVNEDLNSRLASMREQILSRSRIEPIVERFDLFSGNKATMDDRVDLTRKAIGITPVSYTHLKLKQMETENQSKFCKNGVA